MVVGSTPEELQVYVCVCVCVCVYVRACVSECIYMCVGYERKVIVLSCIYLEKLSCQREFPKGEVGLLCYYSHRRVMYT